MDCDRNHPSDVDAPIPSRWKRPIINDEIDRKE